MTYLPIASIVISALGLVAVYFGFIGKIREDIAKLNERCEGRCAAINCIPQMKADLATLTAADKVFWQVLAPHLATAIHSPIHKTRDRLVDEFIAGTLNEKDLRDLRSRLREMLEETDKTAEKRLAGALLLGRVEERLVFCDRQQRSRGSAL